MELERLLQAGDGIPSLGFHKLHSTGVGVEKLDFVVQVSDPACPLLLPSLRF